MVSTSPETRRAELTLADAGVVGIGLVAAIAVFYLHRGRPLVAGGLVGTIAVSAWLSAIDIREHRLPNRIVAPLALCTALWVTSLGVIDGDLGRTASAFGWGFAALFVFFGVHLVAHVGMGDVKYAWPIGVTLGWFGWQSVRYALLVMCLLGGLAGAVAIVTSRRNGSSGGGSHQAPMLAFGPFMACGLIAGLLRRRACSCVGESSPSAGWQRFSRVMRNETARVIGC